VNVTNIILMSFVRSFRLLYLQRLIVSWWKWTCSRWCK